MLLVVASLLVVALIALRMAAPPIIERRLNEQITSMPGLEGNVGAVKLRLWRAGAQLRDIELARVAPSGGDDELQVRVAEIDARLVPAQLLRGRLSVALTVRGADVLQITGPEDEPVPPEAAPGRDWRETVPDDLDFEITRLTVRDTRIRFLDTNPAAPTEAVIGDLQVELTGLRLPDAGATDDPAGPVADRALNDGGTVRLRSLSLARSVPSGEGGGVEGRVDAVDVTLAWNELFGGRIQAAVDVRGLDLAVVKPAGPEPDPGGATKPAPASTDWREALPQNLAITLTRLTLSDARVRFRDQDPSGPIEASIGDLRVSIGGLRLPAAAPTAEPGGEPDGGFIRLRDLGVKRFPPAGGDDRVEAMLTELEMKVGWQDVLAGPIRLIVEAQDLHGTFTRGPGEEPEQPDTPSNWRESLPPEPLIVIARFTLEGGRLAYREPEADPAVDLALEALQVAVENLPTRPAPAGEMPTHVELRGTTAAGGLLVTRADVDFFAEQPRFYLQTELKGVQLPQLNDLLGAYASVQVDQGTFETYTEIQAGDGAFQGYVKPFFNDIEFTDLSAQDQSFVEGLWQTVVATTVNLFKNRERDQLATRIPFEGRFNDPEVGLWPTFVNMFRHGFVDALSTSLEGTPDPEASAE